jgi:RHS repeat-associated protein
LPDTIQFKYGNQIINRYAADGRKLDTEYFTLLTDLTDPLKVDSVKNMTYTPNIINQNGVAYIDNKEYNKFNEYWGASISISLVHNTEGYVQYGTPPNSGFIYYRTDHLGNNREVWRASSKTTIQRTQYYASGLPWETTPADNLSLQPYKYNGKEFIEMHGYDTYDYGARGYYAAMGRFMTVDPLAEKYYSISPYAYCLGNPMRFIDIAGRAPGDFFLTMNAAAGDFGKTYNDNSIRVGQEYGSRIYMITNSDGKSGYTYTVPAVGKGGDGVTPSEAPIGAYITGYAHTHGKYTADHYDNLFSGVINIKKTEDPERPVLNTPEENMAVKTKDVGFSNENNLTGYVATPNGSLQKYDPTTGKVSLISTQMPSDPKDLTRLNNVAPVDNNLPLALPTPQPKLFIPTPIEMKAWSFTNN